MSNSCQKITNTFVGQPVTRIEDLRLLPGRGQFVDDLSRENLLYAVMFRSPIGHGRILSIDTSAAAALPGVYSIITEADLPAQMPLVPLRLMPMEDLLPLGQPALARDKVRYVGEVIAIILAKNIAIGEDARSLIEIDIEPLPAISNTADARDNRSLLFEGWGSNEAVVYSAQKGDARAAFENADYIRREKFSTQRHLALPMEARGVLAEWNDTRSTLKVDGAAKVPFPNRRILADMLDIEERAIQMIEADVGGGFGARGEFFPEDFLVPFAARQTGRPVKWIEDRRENLQTTGHAREMDCEIEIACRSDGAVIGLRGEVWVDAGSYFRTNGPISPRNVAQFMSGPYRVANIEINSHTMLTNKAPIGTYRGPGRFETIFFCERLFDLAAKDLGIDPAEFRRINLVREDEMPYQIATITPVSVTDELDSGNYEKILDRCIDEIGWADKRPLCGNLIEGVYHGLAVSCFIEGGAAGPRENASAAIQSDGSVRVHVGSTSVGQGVETILTQIAADAMEMPLDKITLAHGSTDLISEGFGSYHSRSTVMGGSAITLAITKLREKIQEVAAGRFGCRFDEVNLVNEMAVGPDQKSATFSELADGVEKVEETFHNHKHTYANGSAAAHVTVDPETGEVKIVDLVFFEDVGKIINPMTLKGQAIGAMVQGLGGTFLEHVMYDQEGQLISGTLADYLVPSSSSFENLQAYLLEEHPSPISLLGAKGAGEGGLLPIGGLMANAVSNALSSLGVEIRKLPLTPDYIWRLINDAAKPVQTFKTDHLDV
ncbi:MAG: xanthine dehydrogenase family protein molybdopterin-binding subunit [Pseudomonadota bacterium]|nr:xanthine dehydrogenase family protein molybdopterin-binding subunit [Pseudomonadota bacterium]